MRNRIFLIVFFCMLACKKEVVSKPTSHNEPSSKQQIDTIKITKSKKSILSNDIQFINDSILDGKFKLDISRYELENSKKGCSPNLLKKEEFYEYSLDDDRKSTKKYKDLGDLNGDGKKDYVFILPGLGWCEEGQSYYFTDNKIPRIQTESNCCHTESVFSIGDIDEDGGNEIAEYNSSCVSNFKAFKIWTLKSGQWKLIADFLYYYNNGKYIAFKDFHKLHRKISKNKFQFLEISDKRTNGELVQEWKSVTMK